MSCKNTDSLEKEQGKCEITVENIMNFVDSVKWSNYPDNVVHEIAEDVTDKVKETVLIAIQFMKQAFREKLTVADMNRSLFWSNVPPVYGHIDSAITFYDTNFGGSSTKKSDINIVNIVNSDAMQYQADKLDSCEAQWVAIEGIPAFPSIAINESYIMKNVSNLSKDLKDYFSIMKDALLGSDVEMLKIALNDLRSNPKIGPLLHHFVTFISDNQNDSSLIYDKQQLSSLVLAVDSLVSNSFLYFNHEPYSSLLVEFLLSSCLQKSSGENTPEYSKQNIPLYRPDYWSFLEIIAQVLVKIMKENSPYSKIYAEYIEKFRIIINNFNYPLSCHYGVIACIIFLGPNSVVDILYEFIFSYLVCVNEKLAKSSLERQELQKIYCLLITVAEIIMIHSSNDRNLFKKVQNIERHRCEQKFKLVDLYKKFYNCFGDAFATRFPSMELKTIPLDYGAIAVIPDAEHSQTGVELLKNFYKLDNGGSDESSPSEESRSETTHAIVQVKDKNPLKIKIRKIPHPGEKKVQEKKLKIGKRYINSNILFYKRLKTGNMHVFL